MTTYQLYDDDAYQTEFEAEVITCNKTELGYEVVLSRTAFFPEEGGQHSDTGTLRMDRSERNGADGLPDQIESKVKDVQIDAQKQICHICSMELPAGSKVIGKINWEKRFSDMQQHSGEHIVSGLVFSIYGFHNVGFHLSEKEVTMDFDGILTWDDIHSIEAKANRAVYEDFSVLTQYPSAEELEKLSYRSKKELEGPIRIVTFPGYDVCACCAPHVHRTGEIGIIKIVHLMKYKSGVRVHLLCGERACADYQNKLDSVLNISVLLSAKPEEVYPAVQKLLEDNQKCKAIAAEMEQLKILKIAENISESTHGICILEKNLANASQRELVNLLTAKCAGYCGVFVGEEDEYRYIIAIRSGDAREMNRKLKELCQVRGGGSEQMVQGTIIGTREQIQKAFE